MGSMEKLSLDVALRELYDNKKTPSEEREFSCEIYQHYSP